MLILPYQFCQFGQYCQYYGGRPLATSHAPEHARRPEKRVLSGLTTLVSHTADLTPYESLFWSNALLVRCSFGQMLFWSDASQLVRAHTSDLLTCVSKLARNRG